MKKTLLALVAIISVVAIAVGLAASPASAGGGGGYNSGYDAAYFQAGPVARQIKIVEVACQVNNPTWTKYAKSVFDKNKLRLDAQLEGWDNPPLTPTWEFILTNDAGLRWLCPDLFSGPAGLHAKDGTIPTPIIIGGADQVFRAAMFQATEVAHQINIVELACAIDFPAWTKYARGVFEANRAKLDLATMSWSYPKPTPTWESVAHYAAPIKGCDENFGAAYAPPVAIA